VISYLQRLISARDMMFDDEILQATFCGTNLTDNEAGCCYHPVHTVDESTVYD